MATVAELQEMRTALERARFSGNRRVKTGNTEIEFKTDAEMQSALDAIDRDLSAATAPSPTFIRFTTSKGY